MLSMQCVHTASSHLHTYVAVAEACLLDRQRRDPAGQQCADCAPALEALTGGQPDKHCDDIWPFWRLL